MDWPIPMSEAARRAGVNPQVARALVLSHKLPTESIPGLPKFVGLGSDSFERFKELAAPFKAKRRRVASR